MKPNPGSSLYQRYLNISEFQTVLLLLLFVLRLQYNYIISTFSFLHPILHMHPFLSLKFMTSLSLIAATYINIYLYACKFLNTEI